MDSPDVLHLVVTNVVLDTSKTMNMDSFMRSVGMKCAFTIPKGLENLLLVLQQLDKLALVSQNFQQATLQWKQRYVNLLDWTIVFQKIKLIYSPHWHGNWVGVMHKHKEVTPRLLEDIHELRTNEEKLSCARTCLRAMQATQQDLTSISIHCPKTDSHVSLMELMEEHATKQTEMQKRLCLLNNCIV